MGNWRSDWKQPPTGTTMGITREALAKKIMELKSRGTEVGGHLVVQGAKSKKTEQPAPKKNDHPAAWDLVMIDICARDKMGERKYSTRLQPFNGRDTLRDVYEEALDMVVYLRSVIYERDNINAFVSEEGNSKSLEELTAQFEQKEKEMAAVYTSAPRHNLSRGEELTANELLLAKQAVEESAALAALQTRAAAAVRDYGKSELSEKVCDIVTAVLDGQKGLAIERFIALRNAMYSALGMVFGGATVK